VLRHRTRSLLKNRLLTAALPYGDSEAYTPLQAYRTVDLISAYYGSGDVQHTVKFPRTDAQDVGSQNTWRRHVFIGLKGNKIWRFLNLETPERGSPQLMSNSMSSKFPIIAEDANGQLLPRKPALAVPTDTYSCQSLLRKRLGLIYGRLEYSTDTSRTDLRQWPQLRTVYLIREEDSRGSGTWKQCEY